MTSGVLRGCFWAWLVQSDAWCWARSLERNKLDAIVYLKRPQSGIACQTLGTQFNYKHSAIFPASRTSCSGLRPEPMWTRECTACSAQGSTASQINLGKSYFLSQASNPLPPKASIWPAQWQTPMFYGNVRKERTISLCSGIPPQMLK